MLGRCWGYAEDAFLDGAKRAFRALRSVQFLKALQQIGSTIMHGSEDGRKYFIFFMYWSTPFLGTLTLTLAPGTMVYCVWKSFL